MCARNVSEQYIAVLVIRFGSTQLILPFVDGEGPLFDHNAWRLACSVIEGKGLSPRPRHRFRVEVMSSELHH